MTQTTAAATALPDLTTHWVGFASLAIFAVAYILVIAEEATHLRKSKPVVVAAGILWIMIAAVYASLGLPARSRTRRCGMSCSNMPSCCCSCSSR